MSSNPESETDMFADLLPITDAELHALHERLEVRAGDTDLLDVAYRTVETPIGTLLLAATTRGLVRVAFALEGLDDVLATLAARISPRVLESPARLERAARQLDEYFAGRRRSFDIPLDLSLSAGFRRQVLGHLPEIAYGRTTSYRAVAVAVGNPRAVRAVGTACATNPIPLVVPCHRVVRSDGVIGSYRGGTAVKRLLLDLEAAA